MQLVEQGKLDLNTDVNYYLEDIKIPENDFEPITLAHLMMHTGGFESKMVVAGRDIKEDDVKTGAPLTDYLTNSIPRRILPPGKKKAYSNYNTSLAGHIVARVSGMSWEDYVEKYILKPLEMNHSTTRQPLPTELASDLTGGFFYKNDKYEEKEIVYFPYSPAAGMSAAAADMANFMIAHLENGRYKNKRILKEATAKDMHSRHFKSSRSKNNDMAYGFFEMDKNNLHILGHSGVTGTFHSILILMPEHNVGLFMSVNTGGAAKINRLVVNLFLDRYFPSS